jgi:DnaK suppressor protein
MPPIEEIKARLERERDRLLSEIAAVAAQPGEYTAPTESYYGNHLADAATETFEEEKAVALEAHLTGLLNQVQAALARIESGTYGICQNCGQRIPPERLEALPYATTCLKCASASSRPRAAGRF